MNNVLDEIESYIQTRELIMILLLTAVFLVFSFVAFTKFTVIEIAVGGGKYPIHISYYGFPFTMIGILNPITGMDQYWIYRSGEGLLQILWEGLLLNFVLYFLLAFTIVCLFRKLTS